MIKKIDTIKNFGIYLDFSSDNNNINSCQDFKKYNFFYGWNYSGKTTLSRLFRFIEQKNLHSDYQNIEFKIDLYDGNKLTHKDLEGNDLKVRVFNEDYVNDNFSWNNEKHSIAPVLILGEENIKLQKESKKMKDKQQDLSKKINEKESCKSNLDKTLSKQLQDKASSIRNILGITNPKEFDKSALSEKITKLKEDNYKNKLLTQDKLKSNLNVYLNQRNYERIYSVKIENKIDVLIQQTNQILTQKISPQQIIENLKNNPELNEWVRKGIDLHQNETNCQFCGNPLPHGFFERLEKHFTKEFDSLMKNIDEIFKKSNNYKDNLEKIQLPDKARFYEEFQNNYEENKIKLTEVIKKIIDKLSSLRENLENKKKKPFDVLEKIDSENLKSELEDAINKINSIITENNKKIENLSKEKEQIKNQLLEHYSAKAIDEITIDFENQRLNYFQIKEKIDFLSKEIDDIEKQLDELNSEIMNIEKKISQSNKGAQKINEYLKTFFADDQIQLKLLEDGSYQIYRNGSIAKNLSTGERNIISLVYFITKLEEDNFPKNNAVVFIDDPVSSLDSNHIFKIYGFLQEKVLDCGQLFITTHNFDFFNLIKDLHTDKEKTKYFLVQKSMYKGVKQSTIKNLPEVLRKFKSEYNFLFSILKDFNDSKIKSNFDLLYVLPNITRRFLEAYLFQKYPDGKKFKEKCKKFFEGVDSNKLQSTLKLLDEYSHEENSEHAHKFPDINEIEQSVSLILETIKNKDQDHYDALCESINK